MITYIKKLMSNNLFDIHNILTLIVIDIHYLIFIFFEILFVDTQG